MAGKKREVAESPIKIVTCSEAEFEAKKKEVNDNGFKIYMTQKVGDDQFEIHAKNLAHAKFSPGMEPE